MNTPLSLLRGQRGEENEVEKGFEESIVVARATGSPTNLRLKYRKSRHRRIKKQRRYELQREKGEGKSRNNARLQTGEREDGD